MHGCVRPRLLHGDGQHDGDGQPVQCGHLLPVGRGVAGGDDVSRWLLLPCRLGCGDALPVGLLHGHDGRDDVHRMHGGLLLCDGQHVGDGERVRRGHFLCSRRDEHDGDSVP